MQTLQPFADVAVKTVLPKGILSKQKMHRHTAEMYDRMMSIETAFKEYVPELQHPLLPDVHEPNDLAIIANTWAVSMENQLPGPQVGTVTAVPQGVLCTFYKNETSHGIFNHRKRTVRHAHLIAKPKWRRVPYFGNVPRDEQKIIDQLSEAGLQRSIRIITGQLIRFKEDVVQRWSERSGFGKFVDEFKHESTAIASDIASGAAKVGSALSAIPTAIADPVITVGTLTFGGWIDE